jgi:hypothetical protein
LRITDAAGCGVEVGFGGRSGVIEVGSREGALHFLARTKAALTTPIDSNLKPARNTPP